MIPFQRRVLLKSKIFFVELDFFFDAKNRAEIGFFKWSIASLLFLYFRSFQATNTILKQIN